MDPNAALEAILRGHMIADHAEALRDWLRYGGFEPNCSVPVDCHEAFAGWPKWPARVTAGLNSGLSVTTSDRTPGGFIVETVHASIAWEDVLRLQDSEY